MTQKDYEEGMRHILEDEKGKVWTGEGWATEYSEAKQYDTFREASNDLRGITNHPLSVRVTFAYF